MSNKKIVKAILKTSDKFLDKISFRIGKNSLYKKKDILLVILYVAIYNLTVEAIRKLMLFEKKIVPSADRVLARLKQKDWKETVDEFNEIFRKQFFSMCKCFRRRKYFDLSIDENRIMRYCKPTKGKRTQYDKKKLLKGKAKNGTHYAHVTISISIVGVNHGKFTLAALPITKKKDKVRAVKKLLELSKKMIRIRKVYFDAEFFDGRIIEYLEKNKIKYMIHAPTNSKIKKKIKELKKSGESYNVCDVRIGAAKSKTKLVIVDKKKIKRKLKENEKRFFAYVTNLPIENEESAYRYSEDFRKRWGQETGFRVKNNFLGKTTTLSYNARIAIIFFALFLYNLWHAINLRFERNKEFKIYFNGHIETYLFGVILLRSEVVEYWKDRMND